MQPNYEEMMRKQQEDYQRSRDPFEYGRQVAQRRYSEIMANIDTRRQGVQQSYGDLYQQARQRAVRGQAAGGPTLSGGMGQQQRDFVSALEMQELGKIGAARENAMRDLFTQGQAAFSNAQLEGQQATQMQLQNQQTQLQLLQQRQAILDSDLPEEQKQAQLAALGAGQGTQAIPESSEMSFGQSVSTAASIGIPVGIATTTLTKVGASSKALASALKGATITGKGGAILSGAAKTGAIKTIATQLGGKTGFAAFGQGLKVAGIKMGLVKAGTVATGKGAALVLGKGLVAIGPVGWGILAIGLTAAAIWGISQATNRD